MTADASVAIIGLGSRGLGVLERIVTLAARAGPSAGAVRVEVVDPTCRGGGVHDTGQPDYLLLNTPCAQVSMFPDRFTVGAEVGEPGPTLYEWARARGLRLGEDGCTVGERGRALRPTDYLPRRLLGEYLEWFRDGLLGRAPAHVSVTMRATEALDLTDGPDRSLLVACSDGAQVRAGYAFLTTGYTPNVDGGAGAPGSHRAIPLPYPLPERTAVVAAGQSVAIDGLGLTAMDLVSCLTVGRGGRHVESAGRLRYVPSGGEPALLLFSRSGIPFRVRPAVYGTERRHDPAVFTDGAVDVLRAGSRAGLDFDRDVLPLLLAEMRVAYRRCQARTGAADRAAGAAELAELEGTADAVRLARLLDALDARLGPFDAPAAFEGSAAMALDGAESYQRWLTDAVARDLAEGTIGVSRSPLKAALEVFEDLRDTIRRAVDFGGLTEASLRAFLCRTVPRMNRAVVGPQLERHAELLALVAAGIAHAPFGPAPAVTWDEGTGRWLIASTRLRVPHAREADWIVSAHSPWPTVDASASPLIDALFRRGRLRRHRRLHAVDVDAGQHPLDACGRADRRIWILGPLCEGATYYNNLVPFPDDFSRPVHDAHRCVAELLRRSPAPT